MITLTTKLDHLNISYPPETIGPKNELLFLDIETTGFSAKNSMLYLIGCVYFDADSWYATQWFACKKEEELLILQDFLRFLSSYKYLIHFNGTAFDLPFLCQKSTQYGLTLCLEDMEQIDLYKRIAPCRHLLKLPNCKQKSIEQFLGICRKDTYTGGELVSLYQNYLVHPSDDAEKAILQHNFDDICGMPDILPALAYYDLFTKEVTVQKVQANYYSDYSREQRMELLISVTLPTALPKAISAFENHCYFSAENKTGTIKVPVFEEEMKYFYSNYKDYYYLPEEDVALHKSVATFVDHEHRVPALASTCYTRKFSQYLPQWGMFREPFFKRDYVSKELFFELTPELKRDRKAFTAYANHILAMIASVF